MHAQVTTYLLDGLRPRKVTVEVSLADGHPRLSIAEFPDEPTAAVDLVVRKAIEMSGFEFPRCLIKVRLVQESGRPAEDEKLSLAIAVAILTASGQVHSGPLRRVAFAGELGGDATIGSVRGALQMAEAVAEDPDLDSFAVARSSSPEAACASGVEVLGIYSLGAIRYIGDADRERLHPTPRDLPSDPDPNGPDFLDIRGFEPPRRAVEIAAAGDHSVLFSGPRGAGHSLLASRIPSILPPLRRPEALEVLRIASASEDLTSAGKIGRPFRAPSPTIGGEEIFGRGIPPLPGEVTLAHNGVLFLEDVAQLHPATFDGLLASRKSGVTIIGSTRCLPSSFFLAASVYPCPCGDLGAEDGECSCEQPALDRYQHFLRATTQRFEVVADYGPPSKEDHAKSPGEPSCAIRGRVMEARARQGARLGEGRTNRQMNLEEVESCGLCSQAVHRINRVFPYPSQLGRRSQVVRVARTIADLAGDETVDTFHLIEAIELQGFAPDAETVECSLCDTKVPATSAHLHQGQWIGESCCWDERLPHRSSARPELPLQRTREERR